MKKWLATIFLVLLTAGVVRGDILSTVPYVFQNCSTCVIDANQMNANFASVVTGVNANAATAGANSNITSLTGLTTPLSYTLGGASVYIGGTSAGSANAQTLASPIPNGFTLVTGKQVNFVAGYSNTTATTLNVASTGATNIFKPSPSGPIALNGGEIVAGNSVSVIFDGTRFVLLTASPADSIPVGTSFNFRGMTIPTGFLAEDGAAVSRATYASLFTYTTFTSTATTTSGSKVVTGLSSTATLAAGMYVGGNSVTCGDTIATVDSSTQVTLTTNNASASGSTTLTFSPWGVGDCSTTFNVPDSRGVIDAGLDNMGSGAASRITSTTCANSSTPGSLCGAQTVTLAQANLPNVNLTGTGTPTVAGVTMQGVNTSATSTGVAAGSSFNVFGQAVYGTAQAITVTTSLGGSGTAVNKLPPVRMTKRIIKY